MNKVNEARMLLRVEYSRETKELFSENIPKYADWLEIRLASLGQPPVNSDIRVNNYKLNYLKNE